MVCERKRAKRTSRAVRSSQSQAGEPLVEERRLGSGSAPLIPSPRRGLFLLPVATMATPLRSFLVGAARLAVPRSSHSSIASRPILRPRTSLVQTAHRWAQPAFANAARSFHSSPGASTLSSGVETTSLSRDFLWLELSDELPPSTQRHCTVARVGQSPVRGTHSSLSGACPAGRRRDDALTTPPPPPPRQRDSALQARKRRGDDRRSQRGRRHCRRLVGVRSRHRGCVPLRISRTLVRRG